MRSPSGRPLSMLAGTHNDQMSKSFSPALVESTVATDFDRVGFVRFYPWKGWWFGQVVMLIRAPFVGQQRVKEFCAMIEGPSMVVHNEMSV